MTDRPLLVASNRGPIAFVDGPAGVTAARRGSGGLATALSSAVQATGGLWVAAAMTGGDRAQAAATPNGRVDVEVEEGKLALRLLDIDPGAYSRYYDGISNRLLWFLHHALWDLAREPSFDSETRQDWDAYRWVSRSFAEALAEQADGRPATVLIQDYHLSLVPAMLRELAPNARIAHFHHVPFAGPGRMGLLPPWLREELLGGLLGADVLGFQTERWARSFLVSCRLLDGTEVDERAGVVRWDGREVRVRVYPITIDAEALRNRAGEPRVGEKIAELERWRGDRTLLLRVDRAEPSKNILRGFAAFEELLRARPEWRGRVAFLALLNPSRRSLPEYRAYTEGCLAEAERINREVADGAIDVRLNDDFDEVVAAYHVYDALMVNALFDGMNLVAKEGPLLNERDGVLLLSRNAGAFAELGEESVPVEPLDVTATADGIDTALRMAPGERARRADSLRRLAQAGSPAGWVQAQVADLLG